MRTNWIRAASAALPIALMATFAAEARAEYRCDNPQGWVDVRACAKAKEGADALRLYIQRTRMIHGLYFWDYWPRRESRQDPG